VRRGTILKVRGIATDEGGITTLRISTPYGTMDLRSGYEGYSWQASIDTSDWKEGKALITVKAIDVSGNEGAASVPIEIYDIDNDVIDRKSPEIRVTSPSDDEVDLSSDLAVEGIAMDDSGRCSVWISLDGGGSFIPIDHDMIDGSFRYSLPAISFIEGVQKVPAAMISAMEGAYLIIKAVDTSGNEATERVDISIMDRDRPVLTGLGYSGPVGGTSDITMKVSEPTCIGSVQWTLERPSGSTAASGEMGSEDVRQVGDEHECSWSVPVTGSGTFTLHVTVTDASGNTARSTLDINGPPRTEAEDVGIPILPIFAVIGSITVLFVLMIALYSHVHRIE